MARDQASQQVKTATAGARGSSARGRFEVVTDADTVVVRNPAADASPPRANSETRTYTIQS